MVWRLKINPISWIGMGFIFLPDQFLGSFHFPLLLGEDEDEGENLRFMVYQVWNLIKMGVERDHFKIICFS